MAAARPATTAAARHKGARDFRSLALPADPTVIDARLRSTTAGRILLDNRRGETLDVAA